MSHRPNVRPRPALLLAGLTLAYAAVGLVFATHGRPVIDEGIYLWAGRLVSEGQLPYRDFPFSQSPMLPYAFAATPGWLGSPILGGRAIAFGMGVLGTAGALWLARRVAGPFAAIVTLLLTCATLPGLAVAATVRAQAVATPLLLLGVAALALPRRSAWSWSLAPSLLLWSTGLRLTNGGVFALVSLWVAWRLRRAPARLAQVAGLVAVQAALVTLPVLRAPGDAFFHIMTAQITRAERLMYASESPPFAAVVAARFSEYVDQIPNAAALVALSAALGLVWARRARRGARANLAEPLGDPQTAQLTLAVLGAVAFAPHLMLPSGFTEYLIPLWALLVPAVGIGIAAELERFASHRWLRPAFALALLAFVCVNAVRGAGAWLGTGPQGFAGFRKVAAELGRLGGPGCTMLTFETELAVEAGCRVVPGLEYSFFSYFVDLPTDEAKRLGVANLARLRERVREAPPDLIALAPGHAYRLRGPERDASGRARVPAPGSVRPLEFLGPLESLYASHLRVWIPTSVRAPGTDGVVPVLVFRLAPR